MLTLLIAIKVLVIIEYIVYISIINVTSNN